MNKIVFGILVAALLPFVSAVDCWAEHDMPQGSWTYSAWLCVSGSNHGWIYSVGPTGHPSAGRMFKVELTSFAYSGMYPATLTCYEQFTDVNGIKGGSGVQVLGSRTTKGGTANSVPQGPLYSWHNLAQVTLTGGQFTSSSSAWVLAGCPPIKNGNQQGGSPPQVRIDVAWDGFGGKRATAVAAPDYTSVCAPFVSYLGDYIDVLTGRTASVLKTKRARR
ncbi:MAG: hypothetical protein V1881_03375 [Candidatus Micrarchaeota archaeon]